ncbi:MAG: hypothetical protein DDT26_01534 [Dehalococcoidia bacterium]|nr:hypothetical protein [Chloroflexota bacterium]
MLVKGGRKDNPYQQLRDNKFAVLNWLQSKALLAGRNLGHINAAVLFGGAIEDQLDLLPRVKTWFSAIDLQRCVALIDNLASPDLQIDRKEAQALVQELGVQPVLWRSGRPQVRDIEGVREPAKVAGTPLTPHQHDALLALSSFIQSSDLSTFSILGMTSTGKTRLLKEAFDEVVRCGKKAVVLAPNRRLASRLGSGANSIYAHLYDGDGEKTAGDEVVEKVPKIRVLPLRPCVDESDCVYLVDDAHLLGNSRFTTHDGKQYGSGRLLDDFFKFSSLGSGERKVVFFGDPYQLQRSGDNESALLGEYQLGKGLRHQSLELSQIIDTTGGLAKLANEESLVMAIRQQSFAEIELLSDDSFRIAERNEAVLDLVFRFANDPYSAWYLTDTNGKVTTFNQWIRERLKERKSLSSLESGDLLEIYVSPSTETSVVLSGTRQIVEWAEEQPMRFEQSLKGRDLPIEFHSIRCRLESHPEQVLNVFEEFLVSERPELGEDVPIAERVLRKSEQQPSLPDFTYARYGYATTVHHAQGMKQSVCYINCDHLAGRHSEGFFRWLYSALTIADREVVLLNFGGIHPFGEATWKSSAVGISAEIPIGSGWVFVPGGAVSERDQLRETPPGLSDSKDVLRSAAIWLRLASALDRIGWKVVRADCRSYVETYVVLGPSGERTSLRIPYNGKNVVSAIHMNDSAYWTLLSEAASACIQANSYSAAAEKLLRSLRTRLANGGWKLVSATETHYRLLVTVARSFDDRISIEINFDKRGLASSVRPIQASATSLCELIEKELM